MKVSEAKEKICPFMCNHVSTPSDDIIFATVNCACGDCMAWEWKETYEKKTSVDICGEEFCLPKEVGWKSLGYDSNSVLCGERILISDSEGYCSRLSNG